MNDAHAPLNQRILIDYEGKVSAEWEPMSSPDFLPLLDNQS